MTKHRLPVEDRFMLHVLQQEGENACWLWTGAADASGYGHFNHNGKTVKAHRAAFEIFNGPIPEDKPYVLHECDNPPCVRPSHLKAGTQKENMEDKTRRGRAKYRDTLQPKEKEAVRLISELGWFTVNELSERLGIKANVIYRVINSPAAK